MTPTAKSLLVLLAIAVVIFVWMFRFDVKPAGPALGAIVTDRWSGSVKICLQNIQDRCHPLYP